MEGVEMENTLPASSALSSSSTLYPRPGWALPAPRPSPKSTDPAFIGFVIKHELRRYTVCKKTANKRGGTSWIWQWGAELRDSSNPAAKHPHWLCCLCWDQKRTFIKGTTSTSPALYQGLREEALWGPEGRPQDVEDL